jgi:hypothetical protein
MQKIKIFLFSTLLLVSASALQAQNYTDALRQSRYQYLGTARFNAMGGSFGALGGDASGLSVNPAGIGIYRSSEFTFTNGFYLDQNEVSFRNGVSNDNKLNFNIGNLSYVAAYKGDPNGWKNYSIAFAYNRLASFHTDQIIRGSSTNGSSIIDDYVNQLNNDQADVADVEGFAYPFGASHAYWNYMINPSSNNSYFREINNTESIQQQETLEKRGSANEILFSLGGNYQDRLFLGTTVAIQSSRFEENRTFTEDYQYQIPALPTDSVGTSYEERTNLIANGTGFTAKVGAIYRLSEPLRVGAAIHIPTFWGIREEYSFNSESRFSEGTVYDQEEETFNTWEYRLRSPWRFIGSLAYLYRQRTAINFDYEYVDYSMMRFNDRRDFRTDYSENNSTIRSVMRGTHNVRFGLEYKVNPFVLRAGFRYEDNPFEVSELQFNPDRSRQTYSVGAGYRSGNFNFDAAYLYTGATEIDPVYLTSDALARIDRNIHRLILTLGWRW